MPRAGENPKCVKQKKEEVCSTIGCQNPRFKFSSVKIISNKTGKEMLPLVCMACIQKIAEK